MTKRARPNRFLSEAHVTRQVRDFLEARGWRAVRMNAGKWVPWAECMRYGEYFRVSERGREPKKPAAYDWGDKHGPDWLFVHGRHGVLYVEMKAEGKKPSKMQNAYLEVLRKEGFPATWTNSFDEFERWYADRHRMGERAS